MSVKQFEEFLVFHFLEWATRSVAPGFRYQFQSPNVDSSKKLFKAFVSKGHVAGLIVSKGSTLPYIKCGSVKLIPVIHGEGDAVGYSENFISYLRDEVSDQEGDFEGAALFIIHNSLLDTLINSADDLTVEGAIYDPLNIKKSLSVLIDETDGAQGKEVSKILLDYQFDLIIEDKGSMFGFQSLYEAICDGNIRFNEISLLDDPAILVMQEQPDQIRKRLDKNRQLYDEIVDVIEHYPDQLIDNLPDFSAPFIEKHFKSSDPDAWKNVTYDEYRKEQESNREQQLLIVDENSTTGKLVVRSKSESKNAQKERHVLLVVDNEREDFDFLITFEGGRINNSEIRIRDRCREISVQNNVKLQGGSKNTSLLVSGAMRDSPRFFSLSINRPKTSEKFNFKCLIVREKQFNTEAIENCFIINPAKRLVTLQTQDTSLEVAVNGSLSRVSQLESVGQNFKIDDQDVIDFEQISNEVDRIEFTVVSGNAEITFDVEGAAPSELLVLPLIFDQNRGAILTSESLNGVYNRSKRRVYVQNKEVKGAAQEVDILAREAMLVDRSILSLEKVLESEKNQISLTDVTEIDLGLGAAYNALFAFYRRHKTLPSLCGWGDEYRALVKVLVLNFHRYLKSIESKKYLEPEHKVMLKLGTVTLDGDSFITSFHPLVLAYYLALAEQVVKDDSNSFYGLPKVTLQRLNPQGLLPFIYDSMHEFSYVKALEENCFWLHCVPNQEANYGFVSKLVKDKISEFSSAFNSLFIPSRGGTARPVMIINSVNNYENRELFVGLVEHVIKHSTKTFDIHVNIYDDVLSECEFDRFSAMASYEKIKQRYGLNKGSAKENADTIVDLLRTRVTYSKFTHTNSSEQAYAHLTFFRNNQKVKVVDVNPDERLSGISCHGLINGEASASEQGNYITGFGLKNVDYSGFLHIEIAVLLGRMFRPARESVVEYRDNSAIALAVDDKFKILLERSYSSSIWTSIIDPKVTLEFFENSQDMLLIHYSDQYTSSASYDAITVTRQTDLYDKVLEKDDGGLIGEFNAFNGEWLLKMITDPPKIRKERKGILAAYKLVSCLLIESGITWVPMSAAEMIRVSGNIGLNMSESEFSRHLNGYKAGAISDDVLFVGFKGQSLYLLPLEVKTGVSYDSKKAIAQAKELRRYLAEEVLGGTSLAHKFYRGLFIRQVLMQIDKYELYSVYPEGYFTRFVDAKEWWLRGDYEIATLVNYPQGFVVANLQGDKCLETTAEQVDEILRIEMPYSFLPAMIKTPLRQLLADTSATAAAGIPAKYFLTPGHIPYEEAKSETIVSLAASVDTQNIAKTPSANAPEIDIRMVAEPREGVIKGADYEITLSINDEPLKVLIGNEVNHGEAVYWEPTNTAKFMNTNSGIIGTMGTGKTQCTKSVVTQLHRNQHLNVDGKSIGVLIFDYKSDYVDDKFLHATSAKKHKLFKLPYNPLSLFGDTPMLPVHTAAGFSETMSKAYGLGKKQQLVLENTILDCYEKSGIQSENPATWSNPAPTIEDVWLLYLESEPEQDSLYAALSKLARFKIFEDDVTKLSSLYELIDGITVIELAGYPPQVQNLVVALTLDLFYSQMQKKGKPVVNGDFRQVTKLLLVDEADNFMSQDFPSLRKILKEGREYGVGVILSTQDITHFKTKDNDYSSYILSWVVHRVSQIKNQDIKSLFNIDDKAEQDKLMVAIRGLDKHYSLYVNGDKKVCKIKDKAFWEL
jgi:DNA phosphorothioation-dependent restriction protein DptH